MWKPDNKIVISNEEATARRNAMLSDIYPLIKRDGTFICFISKETYVSYYGNFKDYPDKFVEDNITEKMPAIKVDRMILRYIQKNFIPSDTAIDRMITMKEALDKNQDFTDKMMRKYPKDLFPNRYPNLF